MGGQGTGLVDHIGQYVGSIRRKAFAGNRMLFKTLDKRLVGCFKFFRIFGSPCRHIAVVQDDYLDTFGPHNGANSPAARMPRRPLLHVGKSH